MKEKDVKYKFLVFGGLAVDQAASPLRFSVDKVS